MSIKPLFQLFFVVLALALSAASQTTAPPPAFPHEARKAVAAREKLYRKLMHNPDVWGVGVNVTQHGRDVVEVFIREDASPSTFKRIPREYKGIPVIVQFEGYCAPGICVLVPDE